MERVPGVNGIGMAFGVGERGECPWISTWRVGMRVGLIVDGDWLAYCLYWQARIDQGR